MKKIMFNDRYGLTRAVIEGRKTMTRRVEASSYEHRYKVGEIVAVAQSYKTFPSIIKSPYLGGLISLTTGTLLQDEKGWSNKMFVRADMMPYQVRFTAVRAARLQDISDEECIKEGVGFVEDIGKYYFEDFHKNDGFYFNTPREAFAALIDKVSGRGTWKRNPWVWVYEFERVK